MFVIQRYLIILEIVEQHDKNGDGQIMFREQGISGIILSHSHLFFLSFSDCTLRSASLNTFPLFNSLQNPEYTKHRPCCSMHDHIIHSQTLHLSPENFALSEIHFLDDFLRDESQCTSSHCFPCIHSSISTIFSSILFTSETLRTIYHR